MSRALPLAFAALASVASCAPVQPGAADASNATPGADTDASSADASFRPYVWKSVVINGGGFVTGTSFRGAADPSAAKWWQGWTNYAEN